MAEALAQTIGYVNRARAFMPPAPCGPSSCASTPAPCRSGYLVFSSESRSLRRDSGSRAEPRPAAVRDAARRLRAAAVWRQSAHHRHPRRSRPLRAVRHVAGRSDPAVTTGNVIMPSGNVHIGDDRRASRRSTPWSRISTICSSCRSGRARRRPSISRRRHGRGQHRHPRPATRW